MRGLGKGVLGVGMRGGGGSVRGRVRGKHFSAVWSVRGKDGRSMVDGWMCAVCTCMRIYMNRCVQMKVCSAWTRAAVLGSAVGRRVDDGGRDERGTWLRKKRPARVE